MKKRKILIVEDDPSFGSMLEIWFRKIDFDSVLSTSVQGAKRLIKGQSLDLILTDLRLPDGDGIGLLQWIREQKITSPVIIMTSYAEVHTAVAAMKLGAEDYLEKPINHSILKEKIENALKAKPAKASKQIVTTVHSDVIIGKSVAACQMYDLIRRIAPTKMSVLLLGESGTGKEYAARMIHEQSPRKNNAFLAVDCGALSKELAPSELFGHLKGSFTSAVADKVGVFVQAAGGTVFLDEVGNLSYEVQIQLLRALQEQKIRPVGSAKDMSMDVRIVAATNENLETAITEGRFREDLFHRLNEMAIILPPLRNRVEDIPLFAESFLQQANQELERDLQGFSEEALQTLQAHHWSGNLRELRNVIRRAVLFSVEDYVTSSDLPVLPSRPQIEDLALRPENEKEQIEGVLQKARGNKTLAAQLLKIDRKTLYNKIHLYGIKL